ncbi:hypothetical protein DH2020_002605 [Rehmannia glutinosa]|uniref:Peptidase A1 domain-containing protein n=1 Tax=Rehmannia glutinosa TaxID=99300 RepID=A0ABR0XUV1_REHGL
MAKTMIILKPIFISYVALISLVSMYKCDSLTKASTTGFTTDLIHRDSPQSPYYDPSLSPTQRIVNALRRSLSRKWEFIDSNGEYLVKYAIGNPPVSALGTVYTSKDVTWTQCEPCLKCFSQNLPLFNPKKSFTYRAICCNTSECNSVRGTSCSPTKKNCLYYNVFAYGSFTQGLLSTETFTLASSSGQRVSIPNFIFACGFRNAIQNTVGSGIVGLGGGNASLVRQLGPLTQGRFSYCLVTPFNNLINSSKLNFGDDAVVKGREVAVTPLAPKGPNTFYFLTLLQISVGDQRLNASFEQGNIVMESGTMLTKLPNYFYYQVKKALLSQVKLKQIRDPTGLLDLCFLTRGNIQMPNITFHFEFAEVYLKQENMFIRTSEDSLCFAAKPAGKHRAVLGYLAQVNFLVGFDLERRVVFFKPTDCGSL